MYRTVGLWATTITVFCLGVMAVMWVMLPDTVTPPAGPPPECGKIVADVLKDKAKAQEAGQAKDSAIPAECIDEAKSAGL
ncbi:hypothetical protein [Streptomyces beijiangensis]|uniref:Uncharacterized protein n=1 Tax=Streptomyces beijiangensis TaxID=163361 RepID=A0A939JIC2_9ACTN|nr:hypothetical protein [Streptomyces beijiangensis]MBO0513035.1 hypothetical protein [Streptomyces beijiangensis]